MGKNAKIEPKSTNSHKRYKEKAKARVDDLQQLFIDLQTARRDSRSTDVAYLEDRVQIVLRDWKAELDEPSPASSFNLDCLGTFSADIERMLQDFDVEDDASSELAKPLKNEIESNAHAAAAAPPVVHEQMPEKHEVEGVYWRPDFLSSPQQCFRNDNFEISNQNIFAAGNGLVPCEKGNVGQGYGIMPSLNPPPSAFLGPICALWDCPRPVQGSELCKAYCSSFHDSVAFSEGQPGNAPVMRRGGIILKDDLLFSALIAETQGRRVGIPICVGAATAKSPWNTPELFDITIVEGETVREWLFFDKSRRAIENGNIKQRSLPDHNGRGWHESRKQVMKEYGGVKRSYYMDPQPLNNYEWHLYVYELDDCVGCALHRLQFKKANEKKSPKGKGSAVSPADKQKHMDKLTVELNEEDKLSVKDVSKSYNSGNLSLVPNQSSPSNGFSSYGARQDHGYQDADQVKGMLNLDIFDEIDFDQLGLHNDLDYNFLGGFNGNDQSEDVIHNLLNACTSSLGPKCALWDCSRPAQGSNWCPHYCSNFHATLAQNEGQPGAAPIQRPGGTGLKDDALFATLTARLQGIDVGIPECEGAATKKSPWNSPELFDISILENETIREWLFFSKPQRAYESGSRKQRLLPDYSGRGWHASRKQTLKEFGGMRRSYYMDPQPQAGIQWHLFEYAINSSDAIILYKLEFKLVNEETSPSKKTTKNSLSDLQKRLGRLTTEFPEDRELTPEQKAAGK
ncbi:hypothetical protein Sjap_025845 [Stephania japonica]|uniref:Transcription factor VOZ1 n=1 Tax=Stephania japonica TaxID=461633 RepID=A0AAP0EAA1_9MAGN